MDPERDGLALHEEADVAPLSANLDLEAHMTSGSDESVRDAQGAGEAVLRDVEIERGLEYGWSDKEAAKVKLLTRNTEERHAAAAAYGRLRDGTAVVAPDSDPERCGGR